MSDISASERRLSAALDRIDQFLELGGGRRPAAPAQDSHMAAQLAALQARLDSVTGQLAELARANEELKAANRALIEATPGSDADDGVRQALEAEIGALRAARAAEIAHLGEVMAQLEHCMAGRDEAGAAADMAQDAILPEVAGDQPRPAEDENSAEAARPDGAAQQEDR